MLKMEGLHESGDLKGTYEKQGEQLWSGREGQDKGKQF